MFHMTPVQRKYWREALAETVDTKRTIDCLVDNDGLLFRFKLIDIEHILAAYPTGKRGRNTVWYFNKTRDREIAELDGDEVIVNPQFVYRNFSTIVS